MFTKRSPRSLLEWRAVSGAGGDHARHGGPYRLFGARPGASAMGAHVILGELFRQEACDDTTLCMINHDRPPTCEDFQRLEALIPKRWK